MYSIGSWQPWAIRAAVFAALTAIFAKVGVEDVLLLVACLSVALIGFGLFPFPGASVQVLMSRKIMTAVTLAVSGYLFVRPALDD